MANHPSFAVIVPARNAAKTLAQCLESVFQSSVLPDEVLVVNDGSLDATAEIASGFPCRILNVSLQKGPMPPRLAGAKETGAPILIFVDADVQIKQDTFQKILTAFKNPDTHAVTGLLGCQSPASSFFSVFKNEYMHYIFKKQPQDSRFLYGSLWAIRKDCLIDFEPLNALFGGLVSDSELGILLKRENRNILLDHSLEVTHLKEYNFSGILKNDFQIPFSFAVLLAVYHQKNLAVKEKRFSHASLGQVTATALAFMAVMGTGMALILRHPAFWYQTVFCLFFFYAHWSGFLKKLSRTRGVFFALESFLFLPLDQAVMFCGMTTGFLHAWTQFPKFAKASSKLSLRRVAT